MAYFEITNVTTKSFDFTLADLQYPFISEHYSSVILKIDGSIVAQITPIGMTEIYAYSFTLSYDFDDLGDFVSGKEYNFSVTAYTANGTPNDVSDDTAWTIKTQDGKDYLTVKIPYPAGNTNISLWTWNEYPSAYDAITQKTATTNFSRKTWDAIVDKVVDVLHNGLDRSWDIGYASVSDTKMSSSDKELTAIRFNSVRNNIELAGNHPDIGIGKIPNSDIPHPVYPGDYVLGEYFLTLTNYINDCIKVLNNK